ncbi:MAG: hypothetical protein O7D33_06710 [Chloroflexi bacterium]|nr:hypothetical protein [Chloroflexota bacterium]
MTGAMWIRRRNGWLLLLGSLALLGLLGCDRFGQDTPASTPVEEEATPQPSPTRSPEPPSSPSVDRIVYVGSDLQIYTVNPDGTDRRFISGGIQSPGADATDGQDQFVFGWPSWSPDGTRLLFSGYSLDLTRPDAVLFTTDAQGDDLAELFASPTGALTMVAAQSPHYALWSPDSKRVAFLAGDESGLSLYLVPGSGGEEARLITTGAPIYLAWSGDSRSLLLHHGPDLFRVDVDTPEALFQVGAPSGGYRAPAWSPKADMMAFIAAGVGGRDTLDTSRLDGSDTSSLAQTVGFVSFLWSPQGDRIAIGQSFDPTAPYVRDIRVVNIDTKEVVAVTAGETPILAFFWSPDGSKIALVVPSADGESLRWHVVDSRTGTTIGAADFLPSSNLVTALSYFDQYAYSLQVWSPDSGHIVFTGALLIPGDVSDRERLISQVFVWNVEGRAPPAPVDEGYLASWSN